MNHNWYFRDEDKVNHENNFIVDLFSSKQLDDLNIYIKATNLFNKSYSGDERFEQYKKQFSGVIMPSYSNVDVKDLGRIADYLLGLNK